MLISLMLLIFLFWASGKSLMLLPSQTKKHCWHYVNIDSRWHEWLSGRYEVHRKAGNLMAQLNSWHLPYTLSMSSISWASRSDGHSIQQKRRWLGKCMRHKYDCKSFVWEAMELRDVLKWRLSREVGSAQLGLMWNARVIKCCHRIMVFQWHVNVETFVGN